MESGICTPSDQGQKEAFLNGLSQFLSDKGRHICKAPKLAGKIIDLHDLYNRVTSIGGYQKVTDRGLWEEFLDQYGFPAISVTLAYGLQKIYQTYLEEYEKVHHFGDDEMSSFPRTFVGYRRFRYAISETQRIQNNMNMEKPLVSDYDRVVLSLESCLPNEIDFAVNACTLLSGESRHVLRLPQCRRVVDALLLHAGIVSDGFDSYREVLEELQRKTHHDFRRFWTTSVSKPSVLSVLLPLTKDKNKNGDGPCKNVDQTSAGGASTCENGAQSDAELDDKDKNFIETLQRRLLAMQHRLPNGQQTDCRRSDATSPKWADLFHGHRLLGVQDYEGQRVLQIALVLLNLSFEDFNVVLLARHPSLLRFVFLCIHSRYSCLRQTGLDILSNISSHIQLIQLHFDIAAMMFDTVHGALLSEDKFERIRGFEILGNICRNRGNADHVCMAVGDRVYEVMVRNLLVCDVELLLSAIEALYRLSKLGETTCTKMIFVRGCVDLLICLVTLNVRSFGPEKLSEIRLARRIAPGIQQQSMQQQSYQVAGQPPTVHPNHGAAYPRPMHYQHPKLGSVHQARPTFAPAAQNVAPMPIASHSKPPIPQPVRMPQPAPPVSKVQQQKPVPEVVNRVPVVPNSPPSENNTQSTQPVRPPPPVIQQQPTIRPSTPVVTAVAAMKSPPGAGAIYTHPEMGTVPPVYHYMPAPPSDIVQDNSPDSFTKLWIWATYEFEMESYIPRVDVYCEYLASSNRYGRQGKTEVLSATDFGKCLKAIFPQASSRLFNQGRGQPQYHIAGIKKRATPFPVPGYQLKDLGSVFSSEYQKIPVTRSSATTVSQSNCSMKTTIESTVNAAAVSIMCTAATVNTVVTTSVPIQQLQFQPVMVLSVMPGSVTSQAVTAMSTSSPQVSTSCFISNSTSSVKTVTNSKPLIDIHASSASDLPGSTDGIALGGASASETSAQGQDVVDATSAVMGHSVRCVEATPDVANAGLSATIRPHTVSKADNVVATGPLRSGKSDSCVSSLPGEIAPQGHVTVGKPSGINKITNKTEPLNHDVMEDDLHSKGETTGHAENSHISINENRDTSLAADSNHTEATGFVQVNGFPEAETTARIQSTQPEQTVMSTDFVEETSMETEDTYKCLKSNQNSKKISDNHRVVVNGYGSECEDDKNLAVTEPDTRSNCVNGEILHSDIQKVNCTMNGQSASAENDPGKTRTSAVGAEPSTPVASTSVKASGGTSMTVAPYTALSVTCAVTPTNPLPHSTLNQRLKDTITRRKNSQLVTPPGGNAAGSGNTTPVNATLPPSLIQQYSYRQQPKPRPEEVNESAALAQQIIPVTPLELQQQCNLQRQQPVNTQNKQHIAASLPLSSISGRTITTQFLTGNKRPNPHPVTAVGMPPAKVLRTERNVAPQPTVVHQAPMLAVSRPQSAPGFPQRLPHPQMAQWPPGHGVRTGNPGGHPHQPPPISQKVKPPTIDLMAPNASLLVLYRNVGKIPFANHLDEKEDAISKSIRLTACLILTNIVRYSDLGRSMLQRHEGHLAGVAMSQMDCSPIVSRLLSEMDL